VVSRASRFSAPRISVRDTAFGEPGFDKMVPAVELLFENVGDDLTGQEILAARFLALTHLQPLPARSRAAIAKPTRIRRPWIT
jgi:hypothetical protein